MPINASRISRRRGAAVVIEIDFPIPMTVKVERLEQMPHAGEPNQQMALRIG
jgi:hypothetical protein